MSTGDAVRQTEKCEYWRQLREHEARSSWLSCVVAYALRVERGIVVYDESPRIQAVRRRMIGCFHVYSDA